MPCREDAARKRLAARRPVIDGIPGFHPDREGLVVGSDADHDRLVCRRGRVLGREPDEGEAGQVLHHGRGSVSLPQDDLHSCHVERAWRQSSTQATKAQVGSAATVTSGSVRPGNQVRARLHRQAERAGSVLARSGHDEFLKRLGIEHAPIGGPKHIALIVVAL